MKNVLMILWGAATSSGWWACAWWGFGNPFIALGTIASTLGIFAAIVIIALGGE
jgi:hypothetical protein